MEKKSKILKIGSNEIPVSEFLNTLNGVALDLEGFPIEKGIKIPIQEYSHLGFVIENLLGVSELTLRTFAESDIKSEKERNIQYGVDIRAVCNILKVISKMIPTSELALLDIVTNELEKQS